MGEQSDRVAVVFGGASGIGAAIAARFTAEGWRVEVADLPAVDVTDEATVAAFLDGVVAVARPARRRGQQRRRLDAGPGHRPGRRGVAARRRRLPDRRRSS